MIHLKIRTEYSFQKAYGPIKAIIERAAELGATALSITDIHSTWGHVDFFKQCTKAGVRPIFGLGVNMVAALVKERRQRAWGVTLLARNVMGLRELYSLNSLSFSQQYYIPRVTVAQVNGLSSNVIVLSGMAPPEELEHDNLYYELNPGYHHWNRQACELHTRLVYTSDVYYPTAYDRDAYEIVAARFEHKTTPQHILGEDEIEKVLLEQGCGMAQLISAEHNTHEIARQCIVEKLPRGRSVTFPGWSIEQACQEGKHARQLLLGKGWWGREYDLRLKRELDMIKEKKFSDYFFLVADMVRWAKERMLVGPARGSAAGSLVCYLLGITEVDPIPHGLLFERFIDITRSDLPDIDLDFPDTTRDEVYKYLSQKYGANNVSRIGTISRLKPKSAIGEAARAYAIPFAATAALKDAIIERSGGDARAAMCITDAFSNTEIAKEVLEKYPSLINVAKIENHARHCGVHAAGVIVCDHNIQDCCTVAEGTAQLDKHDVEYLDMLKIDVLGLRTLSVLGECLKLIGRDAEWMYALSLEDEDTFSIFNQHKFAGIFQFEGYALQILCKQMGIHNFDDIVAITSLARPGPLHGGGAALFVKRRIGEEEVTYEHPLLEPYTKATYGVPIYQEQIMVIARGMGKMGWDEVNTLRKGMSKSLGDEFFDRMRGKFVIGAVSQGVPEDDALRIWKSMCTFGSYAFNKSHSCAYGMLSYYCGYMKAHHPLEFALACLNNEKEPRSTIRLLRELVKEGFDYEPWHPSLSKVGWSIHEGKLIGGLTGITGIGPKTAQDILWRRENGLPLMPGQESKLLNVKTAWDDVFETQTRYGDVYCNPQDYNIKSMGVSYIKDIQDDGTYIFIGRLMEKNQRDMNEYESVVKRGGKVIEKDSLFLNIVVEDDTDSIMCTVNRFNYAKFGRDIVETGQEGVTYYVIKGTIKGGWRKVDIKQIRKLG